MYKRKTNLILKNKVYITNDSYLKLREMKRKFKKSMAQIVIDLIEKEYGNEKL